MKEKIILTDADGVLFNWEYAFSVWMEQHGFTEVDGAKLDYDMGKRYGISGNQVHKLIKIFNESAAIGFLPALRDAMYYVKRLHEEHSYSFHCITSLSLDPNAKKLRQMNLDKLFGPTAFTKLVCLDTGAHKDDALIEYKDSGLFWIEDKVENAEAGLAVGLTPILIEHGFNMNYYNEHIPLATNRKQVYDIIVA